MATPGQTERDCDDLDPFLHPAEFFLRHLPVINHAIHAASRRASLRDEELDDFASHLKLKLIEDDYAVIRKYEQRSSFMAFISVVIQRALLDYRIAQWGKWHASAQARRLGDVGVTIEAILVRDGKTIDEALPALLRRWPDLTRDRVREMLDTLPARTLRPRDVNLDEAAAAIGATAESIDDAAFESDRLELSRRIGAVVRETMTELDESGRAIFRLRFQGGMSVADISRTLKIDQKPLYRRIQRALTALRERLEAAGITSDAAIEVLASRNADLDFGFDDRSMHE
jgi:RNA polymerase sigma factor for flagellar operon FliA